MSVTSPHTRWMTPPPLYIPNSGSSSSSTTLKPYLQLPHLLSLTWLAYPILSLLFVIFRLQLSSSASQDAVANAKGDLLTSCKAAEQASSAAASMPRFMAAATNRQFADAVNGSMNGAREALVLSLTVMEAIINFIVDIYRSTFLCFLELIVRGGLAILIGAVQEINSFVQNTTNSIRTSIQNDVSAANSAIQSAVSAVNRVNPFGNINVPQFNIPSLDALQNVTLPTDFEDALTKLNASLPSVSDLKDKVNAVLDTPFELLKKDINDTFAGLSFDASVLPVPEQNTLSFCGNLDTSVVDDLGHDLLNAAKIGTIILILLVLLLLAGNCALEWYKWRCMKQHLEYTRQAWLTDPTIYHTGPTQSTPTMTLTDHNLLILQANGAHPLLTRIANTLSARLRMSPSQHTHLQWFFHYVFHPPALACFLIGFFGLLSVQLQLIAIGPLEAKYQARAASSVSDFSNLIATSINDSMYNQSSFYANDVNGRVDVIQNSINNGLFGWVNGTTTTLNDTLVTFYDDIQNAVSTVFNGTILESPAQDFIKCFIGSKVDALEEALTFLNENLNVQMPRINESVLVLSSADVNAATQPIATAAIGGGDDNKQGLIGRLVNTYVNSLKKERIMFAIFMGLWGLVVLMALAVIFWHSYGQSWVEAHKKRKWQREQRDMSGMAPVPFRSSDDEPWSARDGGHMNEKGSDTDSQINLRSFTPLPEPKHGLNFNPFRRSTAPPANHGSQSVSNGEKGMVSFFDLSTLRSVAPLNISKPKRLMAMGRKSTAKEQDVGEEGDTKRTAENEEKESWVKRVKGSLFNKDQPDLPPRDDGANQQGSPRTRIRPYLIVSVASTSGPDPEVVTVEKSPRTGPTSHWSTSPVRSRVVPWINAMPKTSSPPPSLPVKPIPRRNVSVPTDVLSTYDDSALLIPKETQPNNPTPLAVPLHHGFDRPIPPGTPMSPFDSPFDSPIYQTQIPVPPLQPNSNPAVPRDWHRRSSSVPAAAFKYAGHRDGSTPGTRMLVTSPPRQSTNVMPVDPFATPFDDDARVTNHTRPSNKFDAENPFAPVVL